MSASTNRPRASPCFASRRDWPSTDQYDWEYRPDNTPSRTIELVAVRVSPGAELLSGDVDACLTRSYTVCRGSPTWLHGECCRHQSANWSKAFSKPSS